MNSQNQLPKEDLLAQIKELNKEIQKLKARKKYGLVWEDKPEEFDEKTKDALPILKEKESEAFQEIKTDRNKPMNILIEGDNYHSLSVLNYTHKESIDVIYIDPPYNTGNKSWKYNNDYVEKDDRFKHSKFISFINRRLHLARNLLKKSGILIFAIDDYEIHSMRLLLDEIMGQENRIGTVVVQHNPRGRSDDKFFATSHEYLLFYAKDSSQASVDLLALSDEQEAAFRLEDEVSKYRLLPFRRSGSNSRRIDRPKLFYPLYFNPQTKESSLEKISGSIELFPIDTSGTERCWRWGKESLAKAMKSELVITENKGKYIVKLKDRIKTGRKAKTVWVDPKYDASSHGTILIEKILQKNKSFDYPKSLYAVIDSLQITAGSNKSAVILDFFAGSGTTGHATLALNNEDDGNRQFILCTNNENNICEDVTFERVKRVMEGYKNQKGEGIEGLGGNLKYLQTDFLQKQQSERSITDEDKLNLTHKVGCILALKENTFEEIKKNDFYQIYESKDQVTGIYFRENTERLDELVDMLSARKERKVKLYIFSWDKGEYKNSFPEHKNIVCEDIPEPILEVYKNIGL